MEKGQLIMIVFVALVVAFLASFTTVSITGKAANAPRYYTAQEVNARILQAFSSCAPAQSFSLEETGIQVCKRENKVCLIGENYARILNTTSNVIMPLHHLTLSCDKTQKIYTDELPADLKMDVDQSWICCKP